VVHTASGEQRPARTDEEGKGEGRREGRGEEGKGEGPLV